MAGGNDFRLYPHRPDRDWGLALSSIPGAEMEIIMPITRYDGKEPEFVRYAGTWYCYGVGAHVSDEKAAKILQYLELNVADEEATKLIYWGLEGTHFEVVDGRAVLQEPYNTKEEQLRIGYGSFWYHAQPMWKYLLRYGDGILALHDLHKDYKYKDVVLHNFLSFPAQVTYGADVSSKITEYRLQAITGSVDIDATWDSYIREVLNAGLDRILAEAQVEVPPCRERLCPAPQNAGGGHAWRRGAGGGQRLSGFRVRACGYLSLGRGRPGRVAGDGPLLCVCNLDQRATCRRQDGGSPKDLVRRR